MSSNAQAEFLDRLDRHRGILIKVASTYARDAASREDLMQEIVAQLWRSFPRYDGRAAFSTWMYRVALNVAISFSRREFRRTQRVELSESGALERIAAPEPEAGEALERLREQIGKLDELNRALMLLYLDDRPYAEIATILGISETHVATKISRLKERLRRELLPQATR